MVNKLVWQQIFLQDWNLERKDLESRMQIGEFENGNAEE